MRAGKVIFNGFLSNQRPMDFHNISDNQMGSNEEKAHSQSVNNEPENSGPVSPASKSNEGFPVRWDFKSILRKEEEKNEETGFEAPVHTSVTESTGDAQFDREWAELVAKEEAEKQSKFVAENQIAPAGEILKTEETVELKAETKSRIELPKFRSVADIMKGFGNIGTEDEEEFDYNTTESAPVTAENTIPVTETAASGEYKSDPVAEAITEVAEVEMEIAPADENPAEFTTVSETQVESAEVTVDEVITVVADTRVDSTSATESWESDGITSVETEVATVAGVTEPESEVTAETAFEPVGEVTELPSGEVDFAELVEEHSMQDSTLEFTPEVISETLEAIGLEPAFEINMSPVADGTEEVMMYAGITESDRETAADTSEESNEIMSESVNTIFNEEFQPIELAGEVTPVTEIAAPVFVSVEHAWMYAEVSGEPVAETGETESGINSSLPGELPLFETTASTTMQTETHTHNNNKSEEAMKFELPEYSSIIKVIGVGGGGSNAVNHMYKLGIKGVDFLVCNTDKQALDLSPVPHKVVLGTTLTEGRGAGSIPEVGRNAAIENIEDLRTILSNNTKMVFITAGMGGGTGTGAAPVIAGVARELGILTVGIVTVPFAHEGKKRRQYAEEGIEMLKQNVDTLLVIRNDKLREMYGNLKLSDAFAHADDVLTTAAKSIAEIISITQQINVDFADICTVMRNSGVAIMGSAIASGENRAVRAVEMSLNSPLLNDNNIIGARYVLLNIISGSDEITMDELGEITDFIQEAAGQTAEIIKGYGVDTSLGDSVSVTIIATGFQQTNPVNYEYAPKSQPEKVVRQLDETKAVEAPKAETVQPVAETEVNPLEPFLVSKTVETVTVTETKTEWASPSGVEFEIVNTSQEITESVSEFTAGEKTTTDEVTPVSEETFTEQVAEPVLIVKEEVKAELDPQEAAKKAEQEEIQRRANERIQKLRDISLKLKSPQVLNEMENEPAYKRRNVNLENVPHSSESQVSRFTLTENEEKKIEIRPNNSFLHDNVD